jgi:glycosyltransferase involved in cell wall biosynthesis
VPPENPTALADAMQQVLSLDAARLEEMQQNATRNVRENFDIATANEAFVRLCEI